MHFIAPTLFCTPCQIKFDLILKFETLEADQMYLIEKSGLSHLIAPEWHNKGKGKDTTDLLKSSDGQLSLDEMQKLYNYYRYR